MTQIQTEQNTSLQAIQTGLQSFEERKEAVATLAESAKGITLSDFTDKEGLKAVSEKRKELKAERVKIEKEGKSMRDLITPISRHISAKEKELTDIISPEEDRLQGIEKWADGEKERVRLEEEAKEKQRIQDRIDRLKAYERELPYADIISMSDATFEQVIAAAKSAYDQEQAEKAELERQQREAEEAERVRREEEAEQLRKEKEEVQAAKDLMAKEQEELQRQKNEIEQQRQQVIRDRNNNRWAELQAIGFARSGNWLTIENYSISAEQVAAVSEEEWPSFFSYAQQQYSTLSEQRRQREEQEKQENDARIRQEERDRIHREQEEAQKQKIEADAAMEDKDKYEQLVKELHELPFKYQFKSKKYNGLHKKIIQATESIS